MPQFVNLSKDGEPPFVVNANGVITVRPNGEGGSLVALFSVDGEFSMSMPPEELTSLLNASFRPPSESGRDWGKNGNPH